MTKRFGFTLAEVLITLGIIGVVAAMTMPSLMNSTQGAQYKAAYKKALSAISQAVTLNVALDDYNFADTVGTGTDSAQSMYTMFKNRMNIVKTATGSTAGYDIYTSKNGTSSTLTQGSNYVLFFNDGIAFSFPQNAEACTKDSTKGDFDKTKCRGFIDVNGEKAPNRVVQCEGSSTGSDCTVTSPTDVYPVEFYDQTIFPASDAAKAVLYGK